MDEQGRAKGKVRWLLGEVHVNQDSSFPLSPRRRLVLVV